MPRETSFGRTFFSLVHVGFFLVFLAGLFLGLFRVISWELEI